MQSSSDNDGSKPDKCDIAVLRMYFSWLFYIGTITRGATAPGLFSPCGQKIDITTRLTYNFDIRLELVLRCGESPENWIRLYKVTLFYEPTSSKSDETGSFYIFRLQSRRRKHTMEDFNIYFSDLKEESQRRLMEAVGITDPREMNWDFDLLPLATYPIPIPINEEE